MRKFGDKNDPGRRERIIDATLAAIEDHGVSGLTHRRIAQVADVPPSSLTYYFASLDEIIEQAFMRLSANFTGKLQQALVGATDPDQARDVLADFLAETSSQRRTEMVQIHELYSYASRRPALLDVLRDWMATSRAALELHFSPLEARALDALIEGITMHNATQPGLFSKDEIAEVVRRLTGL